MEDLPDAWSRKAHSHRCDCRALRGPWKAQPSVDLMQRVTAPRHLGQAMTNQALNTHTQLHCSTRTVHAYISVTVSTTVQVFASNKRMVTAAPAVHCSIPTVQVYLLQLLQQYQHSQATRCLLVVSTHTRHAYLSQLPRQYQYSQTKRGWLSLSLHPCSCQLCPKISNPNFPTKTNPWK